MLLFVGLFWVLTLECSIFIIDYPGAFEGTWKGAWADGGWGGGRAADARQDGAGEDGSSGDGMVMVMVMGWWWWWWWWWRWGEGVPWEDGSLMLGKIDYSRVLKSLFFPGRNYETEAGATRCWGQNQRYWPTHVRKLQNLTKTGEFVSILILEVVKTQIWETYMFICI